MKIHPPHLPPESCSLDFRRRIIRALFVSGLVVIALLVGALGALMASVWLVPDTYQNLLLSQGTITSSGRVLDTPDPVFVREREMRTLKMYDHTSALSEGIYRPNGYIGKAIILTDTGWFAMQLEKNPGQTARLWHVYDSTGLLHEITETQYDTETGVLYGSIDASGFRVIAFADGDMLGDQSPVWLHMPNGSWKSTTLTQPKHIGTATIFSLYDEQYRFDFEDTPAIGSLVWDIRGRLVGFVDADGLLVPWFFVEEQYASLFEGQRIQVRSPIPITGQFITRASTKANGTSEHGLLVSRVGRSIVSVGEQSLLPGDIIVGVNSTPLVPWRLQYDILRAGDTVRFTVQRNGEELDVEIHI